MEAVIQLPTDEFFNTGIYTYLWRLNKKKEPQRRDKVMLINAIEKFTPQTCVEVTIGPNTWL